MIAGVVKDLVAEVRDIVYGTPKVAGTVYVPIRLELDGDADDGKYWDTNAGGSWQTAGAVVSWPQASYGAAGDWTYQVPTGATSGKTSTAKPGRLAWRMTDNVATPASETASSVRGEEPIYANEPFNPDVDTVDVGAINGNTTAATNMEAQFDGTGLVGSTYPARQTDIDTLVVALSAIDSNVDAILLDTGSTGVVVAAASKTGYTLTSGEHSSIAAAVWAYVVENSKTALQMFRGLWAFAVTKTSGHSASQPDTVIARDDADGKPRITWTVDQYGNRTAVTINDLD